jgi:UDP-N-acetylmuramyl tripeptide synthase
VRRLLALWLGKVVLALARLRGGGGSAIPGLVVERLHPQLLTEQVGQLAGGCLLVTGTNGKTTTVKMTTTILEAAGRRVVTNRTGSNMVRGLLSAIIEQSGWSGRLDADLAVFEVDEPNLPLVARLLEPSAVLVLNLHRDQLDRYGELERTAELVGAGLTDAAVVVLNADDPLVARLADEVGSGGSIRWFGAAPDVRAQLPDDANLLLGTGTSEPAVDLDRLAVAVTRADATTPGQHLELGIDHGDARPRATHTCELALPGIYNALNAAGAVALTAIAGVDAGVATRALATLTPAFGRGEHLLVDGRDVVLQLVKNPSSFTQVIRTQLAHGPARPLLLALNDNFADGRDVSWIWDVDLEALAGRDDRILVSGLRAGDLAVRAKYAGLPCEIEPDLAAALDRFLAGIGPGETGIIVPTYTAMLDLRRLLGPRADIGGFWE